jgi:hypothetical protein
LKFKTTKQPGYEKDHDLLSDARIAGNQFLSKDK